MKNTVALAVLSGVILSQGASAKVIYGEDNRVEVSEATTFQQNLAKSTATMISENEMTRSADKPGLVQMNQSTLRAWLEAQMNADKSKMNKRPFSSEVSTASSNGVTFCEKERFVDQPNPGMCSGFLIAPDLLVTAGHCAEIETFCSEYRWVFGFEVNPETKKAGVDVKEEDIYSCKKVVSNALNGALGLDYAVVQLDRKVINRAPLEIRNSKKVEDYSGLVVIGSPSGLPLKVAAGAIVRKNTHPYYFTANTDTFQGNSGSAVFNSESGVVEGILVRGEEDFKANKELMCIEANHCADDSCRGEDISRLTSIPEVGVQEALNKAASTGDIKNLEKILKLNIWVDFYTKDGESALIKAAKAGQNKVIEILIAHGADVNLKDTKGLDALAHASQNQKISTAALLEASGAKKNLVSQK